MGEITITSASEGATEADLQQALGVEVEQPAPPAEEPKPEPKPEVKAEEKEPGHRGFERRINKLTRANAELRETLESQSRQLAEAIEKLNKAADSGRGQQPESNNGRPQPLQQNFKSYEDYIEAVAEWKFNQKWEERQNQLSSAELDEELTEIKDEYNSKVEQFAAAHEDFYEVLEDLSEAIKVPESAVMAMYEMENGPAVAYHLAKNPEQAKALVRMRSGQVFAELAKISAKLSANPSVPRVTTRASAPPPTVGGTSQSTVSLDKLSYREYDKARRNSSRRA